MVNGQWSMVNAQIVIGGHVYGGGNAGNTGGNTTVTVHAGDLNRVFGGARMANVGGRAFMHIDGAHASNYIVINRLYGGNDIAGTIGASDDDLPEPIVQHAATNGIDKTWNALVLISSKPFSTYTAAEATDYNAEHNLKEGDEGYVSEGDVKDPNEKIYIGQLFGGGDGEYEYGSETEGSNTVHYAIENGVKVATSKTELTVPNLGKTFVDIHGGSIVYAYGGGNNATITEKTVISVDNPSAVVNSIIDATNPNADANGELLTNDRFENQMDINTTFSYPSSAEYQIGRMFGGNNKADMAIRPRWNLQRGRIRNLYGGGNEGRMTSPEGLLMEIKGDGMVVDNVYGGCRKADVKPLHNNNDATPVSYNEVALDPADNPNNIPAGYAARVRVLAGHVNNVYGGNDISGNVYAGNTVGIFTHIYGDVYGGGNGSYAYTDNDRLKNDPRWSDFYYNPDEVLEKAGVSVTDAKLKSVTALNLVRPNAEKVSILVRGTEANPTIVDGGLYVGGNSASLRENVAGASSGDQTHIKIGSYAIIDNVYLGNNGENMIKYDGSETFSRGEGVLRTFARTFKDSDNNDAKFSQMDLTDADVFAKYMEGCAMKVKSAVVFESTKNGDGTDYIPYSTQFGSFYCGGNVGSMITEGKTTINFNDKVIIFNKVVGGCNEANVYKTDYNAQYLGGIMGNPDPVPTGSPEGAIGDKLVLNFGGLKIQPKRWVNENDKSQGLEWNIVKASTGENISITPTALPTGNSTDDDLDRRFVGGNVYGGCYSHGHVNGNVVINLNASLMDRKGVNALFDEVEENEGEAKLYGTDSYNITARHTGVLLSEQGMDPLGRSLNVFGGGYGGDSEIWGGVTINLNKGYVFQIFGGGEMGAIGKADSYNQSTQQLEYTYNPAYSTCINLGSSTSPVGTFRGDTDNRDGIVDDEENMADCEFIYGGSFEGLIVGDTRINLGNGRIFNSFAGSCNATVIGHTETYVGLNSSNESDLGFPWVRDHIYGGNDLGGRILGEKSFKNRISTDVVGSVYNPKSQENPDVLNASAYTEYIQGHVEHIFGGCYGDYDYTDPHYRAYTNEDGTPKSDFSKPWMKNAIVNFKPNDNSRNAVQKIYGAGQGHAWNHASDADRDKMQDRSYVLIDIENSKNLKFQDMEVFGAGDFSGIGMRYDEEERQVGKTTIPVLTPTVAEDNTDGVTASTVIDLMRGRIKDVFGASYKEGFTRRTIVNVPTTSTIHVNRIFGGAYGLSNDKVCDVFESNVNYRGSQAIAEGSPDDVDPEKGQLAGGVYGGNNNCRRTLYSHVNVYSTVRQNTTGYTSRVFGAGYGKDSWSQYTEVNLEENANVYEAYGGGYGGMVLNKQSVDAFNTFEVKENNTIVNKMVVKDLPTGYTDEGFDCYLAHLNPLGEKTNTNVKIKKNAYVSGYCYGAGLGADATVSGTTYIGLHGGVVNKDLYAAGWGGNVLDKFMLAKDNNDANDFVATATAFIEGGTLRNVYGGGYQGSVGYHEGVEIDGKFIPIAGSATNDIPGKTNVVIGVRKDQATLPDDYGFEHGVPAIQRNAYSGGEGGAVFGDAHLTLNNGYIGYVYLLPNEVQNEEGKKVTLPETPEGATARYEAKVHDETYYVSEKWAGANRLKDYGNLFGGGYDDLSSTDKSFVTVWGGTVRGSIHGGGEIATIGRGRVIESDVDNKVRVLTKENYYQAGETHVTMYNGKVLRNVFGGGKGYNVNGYGTGSNKLYTDGYVFGQTEVNIYGGEIGTDDGLAEGYGNVFGGGDIGYVYSPSYFTEGTAAKEGTGSPNHFYYKDENGNLSEDCKVVISPMLQIKKNGSNVSFGDKNYGPYDYVPTDYLNTLPAEKSNAGWTNLYTGSKNADGSVNPDDPEERGIHIHNAVFAGGNVTSNSESYNNTITVFGNTTATLYDVYHHDFITVGTEHTGGLYGGGNLSLVGGYRELNITNYGTDYYGLDQQISLEEYGKLTNRERAYFKLEYQCQQDVTIDEKSYKKDDRISEEEYNVLPDTYKNETYWKQFGFCSIYAGRLLNTIQRADFCGVFGSRLVLQGARDRVAEKGDATEYTINRIGELSLNQQRFTPDDDSQIHGNYFGIYSIVNYLGALTSDVHFDDPRRYVEKGQTYTDSKNYREYKVDHLVKHDRNNGTSWNQVALASGVYLELTTELSTPKNKVYGDITGVVELDLINVKKDIEGGGYVYARNEHGSPSVTLANVTLLSKYNRQPGNEALSNKKFIYTEGSSNLHNYQTSGNFIHRSKRIVDDCYPNNGVYDDGYVKSPAHYWYIKGEVYIYEQTVSGYAGSATAYSREVKIPLTITAGSNGKLKLLNIQPSLYAYYADNNGTKIGKDGVKVDNESVTYHLNDVITWWDWNQLPDNEKSYFVRETIINADSCTVNGVPYPAGTYVLENDPRKAKTEWAAFQEAEPTVKDAKGQVVTDLTTLFRSSNNVGHDTGYVLTFDMNSPKDWGDWYSPLTGKSTYTVNGDVVTTNRKKVEEYEELSDKDQYREGPTYTLKPGEESGLYGQRNYTEGEIISEETYLDYTTTVSQMPPGQAPTGQATVELAYIAKVDVGTTQAGTAISKSAYEALTDKSNYAKAKLCVNTFQYGEEDYILLGELVAETDMATIAEKFMEYNNNKINTEQVTSEQALQYVTDHLSNAYYVTTEGLYGGQYFQKGVNYTALKSWCELTESRDKFSYNYDALDVLIDPMYRGENHISETYKSPYSDVKSVEYEAFNTGTTALTYYDVDGNQHSLPAGQSIDRVDYEKVRNDQLHYTRIQIDKKTDSNSDTQDVYIVTESFINKGTPYAKGQDISEKDFNALSPENQDKTRKEVFTRGTASVVKYYCYEDYTPFADFNVEKGQPGKVGSVISSDVFTNKSFVPNYQKEFTIQGAEPTETTTLYVSRESNAKDVMSEKVFTVVYQYTYYEPDDEGEGVSLVNELHVVNIHVKLESGAPQIGPLTAPAPVLPGNTVGVKAPTVNPGLYEVLTSGWELFDNEQDAIYQRNGKPFSNNTTPLYWYQNQKVFLAFYSKTYLGKTYSNYVPLSVANYHDIDAIMKDKDHHLYVDHPNVERNSKIYIDNRDCESDASKSELDLLKDFFDLSLQTTVATSGATKDHALLNNHVKGGADLEFILNSDVSPKAYTDWTSIGNDAQCFEGNFHGDGYTISGLNKSLFGKLCGNVYNLGVTGSFTTAGVVDSGDGYVENCWINTTAENVDNVKAVFGNPSDPSRKQTVNCYYPVTMTYAPGDAHPMSETQFYNGTVAYNLNGFYLNKRYYDKKQTSGTEYKYLKSVNGTVAEDLSTGYYPASYAFYPLDPKKAGQYGNYGYVEDRYADGDFIYAGGTIPDSNNERMKVVQNETTSTVVYAPIWPDDYVFFGQTLTYDYSTSRPHNDEPTHISKTNGRLTISENSNRVYRAPAYYQSADLDVAHFNLAANLAAHSNPASVTATGKPVYPNMTAIDFFGHEEGTGESAYKQGYNGKLFYQPILDNDEGLHSIVNNGETPNLLVYAPVKEQNAKTDEALTYFSQEPAYADSYQGGTARIVGIAPTGNVHGHLVQSDKTATNDHLLVDKRDFFCPIGYTFADGKRMWYQRMPERYVNTSTGWETVSLPFTAELVTTQQKGEITHFYSKSRTVDGSADGAKIGHEYWLREFNGGTTTDNVFHGTFNYPEASGSTKNANNTFLWDYYYSANSQADANADTYQTYYKVGRELSQYPLLANGTPYIVGFPGTTYREFDLSGEWVAPNTAATTPAQLAKQVITFASNTGESISQSNAASQTGVDKNGYTFKPNYLSKVVDGTSYQMAAAGNQFDKVTDATPVPFRPYFVKTSTQNGAPRRAEAQYIVFDSSDSSFAIGDDPSDELAGELTFSKKPRKLVTTSSLHQPADVRVYSTSGQTIAAFTIQPGETIETDIAVSGVYIIRAANGRYMKKLSLK